MKKFILHGEMAADFCQEINLEAKTIREVIHGLSANFPKFRKFYIEKSLKGIQYLFVDEDQNATEQYCFDLPLTKDLYHILPSIEGSAGALPFVANFGLGYLMQKFMSDLQPEDDGTPEYEVISTNSFIYSENENRAEQGTPVPVVYGQLRVGSKIIHSSIHNYDYNYDDALIYEGNPAATRISKLAADYTFIEPKDIIDLRSQTEEVFLDYADSTIDSSKRAPISFEDDGGQKSHSIDHENEAMNAGYNNDQKSSNEHRSFGPSQNRPVYTSANAGWWDFAQYNQQPRPFTYSPSGSIDYDMRPQSYLDLCVERISKSGSIPLAAERPLSWKNRGSMMTVGSRGNYQKLESIGIHKSLEVISEGPIAGLAGHITGSDLDNGSVYFPYLASDPTPPPNNISLGTLTYDFATNSIISDGGDNLVSIIESGSNYNNFTGTLSGDGTIVNGLSIKADKPINLRSAKIQDITFGGPDDKSRIVYYIDNNETPNQPKYVSRNGLFLLNSGDGSIHPNTNNNVEEINHALDNKYLISEATDLAGTTGVFQLDVLEEDSNLLNEDFRVGSSYGRDGFSFSIAPESSVCQINTTLKKSSAGERESTAEVLDVGTKYLDTVSNSDFETIFSAFKDYTADNNVPWDSSFTIDECIRIYYDQNGGSDLVDAGGAPRNITINVVIGTYTDRRRFSSPTLNISVDISLQDYLTFGSVLPIYDDQIGVVQNPSPTRTSLDLSDPDINYFQTLCDGEAVSLDYLLRDSVFANAVFDAFNAALGGNVSSVTLPSFTFNDVDHGGGRYIKFGVGSGSTVRQGTLIDSVMPSHSIQRDCDNFDSAVVTKDGSVNIDESDDPKGKYHPMLYPRITVFVLRKTVTAGFTVFGFHPTCIDAVAEVSTNGTINQVHLLRVPDNPVYDQNLNAYTPILPHIGKQAPFLIDESELSYEDLGVFCRIDSSDSSMPAKLYINDGSLEVSPSRRDSFAGETSWTNHISLNSPFPSSSFGEGIFPELTDTDDWNNPDSPISKSFLFDDLSEEFETPTTFASINTTIESIDISDVAEYKINSLNNSLLGLATMTFICTGRPTSISITNAGDGYVGKNDNMNGTSISRGIFPETFTISSVNIESIPSSNKGYKPNSNFYVYGISSTKEAFNAIAPIYYSFKGKVLIDKFGSIDDIEIIDGGFGFSAEELTNDLILSVNSDNDSYTSAQALNFIPDPDPTQNFDPDINFPKQDLILSIDDNYLRSDGQEGAITKFYVEQIGKGFNYTQILLDPFSSRSFTPPSFDIEIDDGKLQSITINNVYLAAGYGIDDLSIALKFSRPTNRVEPPAEGEADPNAWARSIFLNDVPIRDKNDRFNYSKFHFDMRVGHIKNGNLDTHIPNELLAESSQSALMTDEFKLPSFTEIINYPLYGPRNQGEKDYYYTYTVKNPEVSVVSLSFKVEKLHYIYEGDESALYVNLIPLIAVGVGMVAGKMVKDSVKAQLGPADPILLESVGMGKVVGFIPPCGGSGFQTMDDGGGAGKVMKPPPSTTAKKISEAAFFSGLAGAAGGLIIGMITKFLISCSEVPWLCFKVGEIIKNSGEIWPAKVEFAIEYGVEGEPLQKDIIAMRGCATNPYVKDILIENFPAAEGSFNNFKNRIIKVYRLTRELDPVTGGIIEARYQIAASLLSITEHVAGFFNYNNTAIIGTRVNSKDHPSVPRKEYLIKGRLIKVPDNYDPTNGTYTDDWSGDFSESLEWTSNPAWIIYDLLTDERYGMGKYGLKESDIDIWSFYTFSQFCDERVDAVIDGQVRSERRHMCNLYLDSEKQAYEYIRELVKIYNCTINFNGGKLYIVSDSSVSNSSGSVMIFTNTNVSEEGFAYSSTPETHRITAATVDYLDERDNYIQKSEYVEDSIGIREHGYSHKKIAGIGITRRGEAHRLAWHTILTRQLEKEIIQFKTGLHGSYLRIGDVIDVVDNNKISKHSGGRIARIISSDTVELDIPASALSDVNNLLIEVPALSDDDSDTSDSSEINDRRQPQYLDYEISSRSGFTVTFTSDLNSNIKQGNNWIIKENSTDKIVPKKYRIKQIKESSPMQFDFTAVEYLEDKYESIDNSTSSKDGIYLEEREYYGHDITV